MGGGRRRWLDAGKGEQGEESKTEEEGQEERGGMQGKRRGGMQGKRREIERGVAAMGRKPRRHRGDITLLHMSVSRNVITSSSADTGDPREAPGETVGC